MTLYKIIHHLEASGCGKLGLRIANYQDITILSPLGIVIQNAPTFGEAFLYASRFLFRHGAALAIEGPTPIGFQ